jgi:uncharacterized membrane-anchored protein YhcB (DUF1043 family)
MSWQVTSSDLVAVVIDIALGAIALGLYPKLTHLIKTLETAVDQNNSKLATIETRVDKHERRITKLESASIASGDK